MKLFGVLLLGLAIGIGGIVFAADTQPATKPTTQPAAMACCGDTCKGMGAGCCKMDDKGKMTCSMGGSCCVKPSTAPTTSKPEMGGMGGMDMGK